MKNSTEAVSITKKLQQSTPSKLSPENDCLLSGPSPVKIIEKPVGVLSEKQLNDSCNVRNGITKANQDNLVNGFLKKSNSSPRMTNGNMPRSPINGVNRYAATNGNGYQRYTPPCENGGRNVRYTPTKEEPQRPRRNSSEFEDFIFKLVFMFAMYLFFVEQVIKKVNIKLLGFYFPYMDIRHDINFSNSQSFCCWIVFISWYDK